ncbi:MULTISPECIES: amino acid permease [Lysobacter]|uniref:Amino acid permease n=1 Tax=Lysobacter gummosus TaxID=262324 RepID=A0ABY3XK43_9GAMM|nr:MULTISPECIES: amino acid permease [Lysobacter]ALN91651.1 amino acid permease family protein [Lysobacter gummosus]UJB21332.1 amino acid permease [Lysobacter capsici]UJQ29552.1 amino acid permease [Lysobacter gummosus]UNP31996.1 amino acid permease [Lysobacter gummosus]
MSSSPAAPATADSQLGHALKSRQLVMMGLGSAIGAGLFLGSGVGVQTAGPAVLLSYLIAGVLVIIVMRALGEMAAVRPTSGAFSVYAADAMGPTAGATLGWLWWVQLVIVIAAESVGAAGLLATIWPQLPVAAMSLVFMSVFTCVNLLGVKNFGEFEFWFAILKVAAILAFIVIGALLLLGLLPEVASPGFANFTAHGGFAPKGWAGVGAALLVVVFAFGGTEIVAVAAAETQDPERSITRAIRTVAWRILVFYIGSLAVIIAVVPWNSESLKSPFAAVLEAARIPGAATAITLVAVVALLSALNANLYGASRMIFSLAQRREAPGFLAHLSSSRVPVAAVLASVAFGFIATALELLYPEKVLPALLNVVGSTCLLVWTLSLVSQLILRRRADRAGTVLPFKMWAFPYVTWLGLGILAMVFVLALLTEGPRMQLLSTAALTLCIAAISEVARRVRARG